VAADTRNGIVAGSALLIGVGAMLAAEQHSPKPLYLLGGVAVLVGLAFELTLRRPGTAPTAEPGPSERRLGRYGI
jgi:hypothetical protein